MDVPQRPLEEGTKDVPLRMYRGTIYHALLLYRELGLG